MSARSSRSPSGEAQELLARARVVPDEPMQRRGDGLRARFLHAAQGHAQMLGLEYHAHPLWLKLLMQPAGDLDDESLLELEIAGEEVNHAGELGQAEDPIGRQVGDVSDAMKRKHVVHAQRLERDVADQDELVVALVVRKRRQVKRLDRKSTRLNSSHLGISYAVF